MSDKVIDKVNDANKEATESAALINAEQFLTKAEFEDYKKSLSKEKSIIEISNINENEIEEKEEIESLFTS